MTHYKSATYAHRKKGHHKGHYTNQPTAAGMRKMPNLTKHPTLKAAIKSAKKLSRLQGVRGKSRKAHK